jgi:putative ABC transport system permease protein
VAISALGIVAGIAASLASTRWVESLLYGIRANDPVTGACVVFLLLALALLSCYLPAHRAANVDPMVALRSE